MGFNCYYPIEVKEMELEKRKTDVRELQDKAFSMFQEAKDLVNKERKEEAIQIYIELIEILNTLRWSNVTKKIQEAIKELRSSESTPESKDEQTPVTLEVVKVPASRPILKVHSQSLKEFELHYRNRLELLVLEQGNFLYTDFRFFHLQL